MTSRPKVAVLLDENTSSGGTRYEAAKGYFLGVSRAGGLPFGLPYDADVAAAAVADFDALLTPGCRFALGVQWHQELFAHEDHPGNGIFAGLVDACGRDR